MAFKFDFGYFYTVEKPINERRFKYEKWWFFCIEGAQRQRGCIQQQAQRTAQEVQG